jgi:hypothetical protein
MVVLSTLSSGFARPLGATPIPDVKDTANYLKYLADDRQFLHALAASMGPNRIAGSARDAYQSIIDTAAANVGNLTPEERAQIIAQARMIPASGYRSDPAKPAQQVVQNIETLANNQGYTGPDAGTVVATTPTASGGTKPISRGELLDNENFGNLVNSVFTAAGGTSYAPASPLIAGGMGLSGTPGDMFNGMGSRGPLWGIDMTKWSEGERIQFLNKVAEFGRDGTMMSWEEQGQLRQMAMNFQSNGDNEPAAVVLKGPTWTTANGFNTSGVISKDDLMENGTFEKTLNSISWFGGVREDSTEFKALKNAIATANYDELSYGERVALIEAFNSATSDNNVTASELSAITKMIEGFQTRTGSGSAPASGATGGTTLSNGLVVSTGDVASPGNFMSMVNDVLDRSGVAAEGSEPTLGYSANVLRSLRGLDVSMLTAEQRIQVLEKIAQAGSDRTVTADEAREIVKEVNRMSGRGPLPYVLGPV